MKVTKSYIKQLVKEELNKVLNENEGAQDFNKRNFEKGAWVIGRAAAAVDGKSGISAGSPLVLNFVYDPNKADGYQYIAKYWKVQGEEDLKKNLPNGINPFGSLQTGEFIYSDKNQFQEINSATQTYGGESYFLTPEQLRVIGVKL
jgi:hypothetical protein